MSGIYGIINLNRQPVEAATLHRMKMAMAHTNKGKSQVWLEGNVGLGSVQLAITPEDDFEQQPFLYKDWVVVFNGRLDNRAVLAKKLNIANERLKVMASSALLMQGYEKWGQDLPSKLKGLFVFVIWNKVTQEVFVARDQIGQKVLLYSYQNQQLVFATNFNVLLAAQLIPVQLNELVLADHAGLSMDRAGTETLYKGVYKVPKASWIYLNAAKKQIRSYWTLEKSNTIRFKNEREYPLLLRETILNALKASTRTSHKVGTWLSGGLDSTGVTCAVAQMQRQKNEGLYTYSQVLPQQYTKGLEDEQAFIQLTVNQEKNILPRFIHGEGLDITEGLEQEFEKYHAPVGAFFERENESYRMAQEDGVRVILDGIPGDMLVSTFNRTIYMHLFAHFNWGKLWKLFVNRRKHIGDHPLTSFNRYVLKHALPSGAIKMIQQFRGLAVEQNYDSLLQEQLVQKAYADERLQGERQVQLLMNQNFYKFFEESITKEDGTFAGHDLILKSNYHGIVHDHPFAAQDVWETAMQIPVEQFFHQGWPRGLYRYAMEGLIPPKIQWRTTKHPFSPDLITKIQQKLPWMKEYIHNIPNHSIVFEYYDKGKIFDRIKRISELSPTAKGQTRFLYNIQLVMFLRWFEKKQQQKQE